MLNPGFTTTDANSRFHLGTRGVAASSRPSMETQDNCQSNSLHMTTDPASVMSIVTEAPKNFFVKW